MVIPDYCVCSECDTHDANDVRIGWIAEKFRFRIGSAAWTATARFCSEYCHTRFGTRILRDIRQPRRLLGYVLDRLSHWRKE